MDQAHSLETFYREGIETMSIIEGVPQLGGRGYLLDTRDGAKYRAIAGALEWPSERPGAVIVVGVALSKDPQLGTYKMRVLAAEEETGVTALVKRALALREDYLAAEWYGNPLSPLMQLVIPMNDQLRMLGKPEFWLVEAHWSRDPKAFGYYVAAIKDFLERRVLDLGTDSPVSSRLLELSPEGLGQISVEDFPTIAALAYAVTSLDTFRPWEYTQTAKEPQQDLPLNTEWNFG